MQRAVVSIVFGLVCATFLVVYNFQNPQPNVDPVQQIGEYKPDLKLTGIKSSTRLAEGHLRNTTDPRVWISMSLCLSHNTELHGKKYYPYVQVTPLAIRLWKHYVPTAKVIIFVIYDPQESKDRMDNFRTILEHADIDVVRFLPSQGMDCVLKSQLQRMWAFTDPEISANDIIATVDANAFPVTKTILSPLEQPNLLWIFQYQTFIEEGGNFPQHIVAAYAPVWQAIVGPDQRYVLDQVWLNQKLAEVGLTGWSNTWNFDQTLTSFGILANGLCQVPQDSGLWSMGGLTQQQIYFPSYNDSGVCWHGQNFRDCNKDRQEVEGGCKWYHFYPDEDLNAHIDKFHQLTGHKYDVSSIKSFPPHS